MKRLIALIGRDRTGKNSVIRLALQRLKENGARMEDEIWVGVDVWAVMSIEGVKVGLATSGDTATGREKTYRLRESLQYLRKAGCHVIICATRTGGKTVRGVEKFSAADAYEAMWIEKSRLPRTELQESSINSKAREVVSAVEASLRAAGTRKDMSPTTGISGGSTAK